MLLLVIATLLLGGTRIAEAHNVLVSATPAQGSAVASGPSRVDLLFNEPVELGADEITVTGPDGSSRWDIGATTVSSATVSVALRPLGPAGVYRVGYHIVSEDGHPVSGSFTFILTTAGGGTPASPQSAAPAVASVTPGNGTVPIWGWVAGAIVLLAVGAIVAKRIAR